MNRCLRPAQCVDSGFGPESCNHCNPKTVYIFFREGGTFYPIALRDDDDARRSAEYNRGTIRVENRDGSRVIWERS